MNKPLLLCLLLTALLGGAGCVRTSDIRADAELRRQAIEALNQGNLAQARKCVERADHYHVPRAQLWRRTMDLRIAIAEGSQQGELRRLLRAWGEQRDDWSKEDLINAELTLAEILQAPYTADWLYDLDSTHWPSTYRTRYNLLRSKSQQHTHALRDDTIARWRLAIRSLYAAGDLKTALEEAERCAAATQNADAALIAAKIYNELGDEAGKNAVLEQAAAMDQSPAILQEINLLKTAPLGTKTTL